MALNVILRKYYKLHKGRKEIILLMGNPFCDMHMFLSLESKLERYEKMISDIDSVLI